jgi:hypothetical protein
MLAPLNWDYAVELTRPGELVGGGHCFYFQGLLPRSTFSIYLEGVLPISETGPDPVGRLPVLAQLADTANFAPSIGRDRGEDFPPQSMEHRHAFKQQTHVKNWSLKSFVTWHSEKCRIDLGVESLISRL